MKFRARDAAVLLAGISAWETLGHWWLGIWGQNMLPLKIAGFNFTTTANSVCMAVWPVALVAAIYIAWFRHPRAEASQTPPAGTPRMV